MGIARLRVDSATGIRQHLGYLRMNMALLASSYLTLVLNFSEHGLMGFS
jgi:hypothetical protein